MMFVTQTRHTSRGLWASDNKRRTEFPMLSDDGYKWRKYGQKHVKGSEFPRSYHKCAHPNCAARKLFERSRDGRMTEIIYRGTHDHPKPEEGSDQVSLFPAKNGTDNSPSLGGLVANVENAAAKEDDGNPSSKRRKMETGVFDVTPAAMPIREPRIVVQTVSEVDILDDGYKWCKYGQKLVRGNPNPRSYYKCTNPGCLVRKHVERAPRDRRAVITTYDGKHNHDVPTTKTGISSHDTAGPIVLNGPSRIQTDEKEVISLDLLFGI